MEPWNTRSSSGTNSTSQVKQDARDQTEEIKHQAQDSLNEMSDEARERATETARQQKRAAAKQADGLANALRTAGNQLDEQEQSTLAQYARKFATSVDNMGSSLRDEDVDSLVSQAQNFARRQPGMFIGGAVAAGFVLARFLKSSDQRASGNSNRYSSASRSGSHEPYGGSTYDTRRGSTSVSGAPIGSLTEPGQARTDTTTTKGVKDHGK